nr:MAG TPA: hypothetical protein [Caudoviricetes sp.]DAO44203.1 MAG TPA: hypothetical protein [Caudoviricetes sp.]
MHRYATDRDSVFYPELLEKCFEVENARLSLYHQT